VPATPGLHILSLHDALPIYARVAVKPDREKTRHAPDDAGETDRRVKETAPERAARGLELFRRDADDEAGNARDEEGGREERDGQDRKSTRLKSSHRTNSYAV